MSIIDKNQPNWFGNAGEPLKSGYIYIGQPNQTPVENPKTVTFTDSSGNAFTATQPLRTNSDGQIVWNGKAITATTDGDYSMLVLDSTQTQINGGHVPLVEGDDSTVITLTNYREYGLLLADIKQVDVSVGQTIGDIGKSSVLDNLGGAWLAVTATGSPADDVDLINFDNGLQGQRIKNFTGQAQTAADKSAVRTDIDVYSKAESDAAFQAIPPAISGYLKAETFFITDGVNSSSFSVSGAMAELAWESVGPTGSGATNIWTALDAMPLESTLIEVLADLSDSSGGSTLSSVLYSRKYGAASPFDSTTQIAEIRTSATLTSLTSLTTVKIPLDAANRFEIGYNTNSGAGSASILLRGFGV